MSKKEKKVVSQFEFAIGEVTDDENYTNTHRPRTDEEELEIRKRNIQNQATKLRIKI